MANEKPQHIDITLDEPTNLGVYANLAIISPSATEFILDFASVLPGLPKAKVRSRVILAPEHAKRLLLSLQENVARYENTFGPIPVRQGTPRDGGKGGFNMGEA